MKNSIYTLFTIFILSSFQNSLEARDYPMFKEKDYCIIYYPGCWEIVTKCRDMGMDPYIYFEQIPCEEACQWYI